METRVNLDPTTSLHSDWKAPNSLILISSFLSWGHWWKGRTGELILCGNFQLCCNQCKDASGFHSSPQAWVSTHIQRNGYTAWWVRWRYSAKCHRQTQVSHVCKHWIAKAPFLGVHTGCLTSELENISCCLLVPAGINEKYHCALTEAQPSRSSVRVCVLTLLFEKAACVFPKPQNQLDECLGPVCLGQEAGGHHVPWFLCEGSVWVFAAPLTGVLLTYLGRANRCPLEKPSLLHFIFLQNFDNQVCFFHYFSLSWCDSTE